MRVLLLGGGLQSSLLFELSLNGTIAPYDLILFADTGNEPKRVMDHVLELQGRANGKGLDFRIVRAGNIIEDAKWGKFRAMPLYVVQNNVRSILKRQCTYDYKIVPCDREIRASLLERGLAKVNSRGQTRVLSGVKVVKEFGITTDETRRKTESRIKWQVYSYPLIDLGFNRPDCEEWYKWNGIKVPSKSSCIVCPYHDDLYWLGIEPSEFELACQFDEFLRSEEFRLRNSIRGLMYLHPSCMPLRSIELSPKKTKPVQISFVNELLTNSCRSNMGFSCFS